MPLRIYGNMQSSTFRCVWAAEELNLQYELVNIATEECRTSKLLASLNPNRKIPVIDDNGFVLWQSMAINLYLARKAGGDLAPADGIEDAQMLMWSFWVTDECLADCSVVLSNTIVLPEAERSDDTISRSLKRLDTPLRILNDHLEQCSFTVGRRFTIADINLASVLGWLTYAGCDLSTYPYVERWISLCSSRAAARKCAAMSGNPPDAFED